MSIKQLRKITTFANVPQRLIFQTERAQKQDINLVPVNFKNHKFIGRENPHQITTWSGLNYRSLSHLIFDLLLIYKTGISLLQIFKIIKLKFKTYTVNVFFYICIAFLFFWLFYVIAVLHLKEKLLCFWILIEALGQETTCQAF